MTITQAVIVAAGQGTRFLPATLTIPKEILPIVDRPMLHYIAEEALQAGARHIVLISARGKQVMEDYFDGHAEFERSLREKKDIARANLVSSISSMMDVVVVRQKEQKGLGHAILSAAPALQKEPFAALLPDDIIDAQPSVLQQMVEVYKRHPGGALIAVERVPRAQISAYGIIDPEPVKGEDRVFRVKGMVEKPAPEDAPSDLGIVGRYILPPEIFDAIRRTPPGAKGEIQITDAIDLLRREGVPVNVYEFHGDRYDVGNPLGALKASIALGLKRPDIGPALRDFLQTLRVHA